MKLITALTIGLIWLVFTSCQTNKTSNLTLFSDQIPTDSALVFGPGIISTDAFEFAITFSPQMDELFFTRRKPEADNEIYSMQFVDGQWSEPSLAFFSPDQGWDFEPHINPKGDKLYFGSTRPLKDTTKSRGLYQWVSEKTAYGWNQPVSLEQPFVDRFVMYLTSSASGNLFFTSREKEAKVGEGGIYYATNQEGNYGGVTRMGQEINSVGEWIAHPFIAPDESYLIYDAESAEGYGENDLFISFNNNGTWTEGYNMGPEVNTEQTEMCASVSPDEKYLFFHRGVYVDDEEEYGNVLWIDFKRVKERIEEKNRN